MNYRFAGLLIAVALVAVACSGDDPTATPTATPPPTPTAPATIGPTPTLLPSDSTPTPTSDLGIAPGERGYAWNLSRVAEFAAKPSLAVDAEGTPHIAYMREAMPGFVWHATPDGSNGWSVSTVAEGYYYGPLDIKVDA